MTAKPIIANLYVPCDPVSALAFMETAYDKIYEVMDSHTDAFLMTFFGLLALSFGRGAVFTTK